MALIEIPMAWMIDYKGLFHLNMNLSLQHRLLEEMEEKDGKKESSAKKKEGWAKKDKDADGGNGSPAKVDKGEKDGKEETSAKKKEGSAKKKDKDGDGGNESPAKKDKTDGKKKKSSAKENKEEALGEKDFKKMLNMIGGMVSQGSKIK